MTRGWGIVKNGVMDDCDDRGWSIVMIGPWSIVMTGVMEPCDVSGHGTL